MPLTSCLLLKFILELNVVIFKIHKAFPTGCDDKWDYWAQVKASWFSCVEVRTYCFLCVPLPACSGSLMRRTHASHPGLTWTELGSPDSLLIEYAGIHTGTMAYDQKWHHLVKGHDPVQNHTASSYPVFAKWRVMLHSHVRSPFNYFHLDFVCLYLPLDHVKSHNTWVGRPTGHQGSGSSQLETQIVHVGPKCALPHT